MLQEPPRSDYDLKFEVFGFPVRVHWGFWVMAVILGWGWSSYVNDLSLSLGRQVRDAFEQLDSNLDGVLTQSDELGGAWSELSAADMNGDEEISPREFRELLYEMDVNTMDSPGAPILLGIWTLAVFLSILVHELGHAFAFRYYGTESHIVLYHFGGLAIPGSFGSWNAARRRHLGPFEQVVISAAGPAAQLSLAALIIGLGYAMNIRLDLDFFDKTLVTERFPSSGASYAFLNAILFPSVFWALINLVPILPLDGGQIMRNSLALFQVNQPVRTAYLISIATGVLCGLFFMSRGNSFAGIMFFIFAANNWQAMQYSGGGF
jgi:Zn-dependent protease